MSLSERRVVTTFSQEEAHLLHTDLRRIEPEMRRLRWVVVAAMADEGADIHVQRRDG